MTDNEERFGLAVAATGAALWDWDIQNNVVTYSPRWATVLGYSLSEFSGHPSAWLDRVHPDDLNAVINWGKAGLQHAAKPIRGEYRMLHKDGHDVWLEVCAVPVHDAHGNPSRAVGTVVDITRRKIQEAETRESRSQMIKVLDHSGGFTGVMTTDGPLIHANEASLKEANWHIDDILGRHLADTYWFARSPKVQQQLRAAIELAASGEDVRFDCVVRVNKTSHRVLDFSLRPIFDASGTLECLVPSAIEITARKALEDRL
ncbi:MAG: PAS domain S-box-containing protein [Gammaproteobacteria bacterium]